MKKIYKKSEIRKLVRSMLINEIQAMKRTASFEEVRHEACKITMPPIFKTVFLDVAPGLDTSPDEVRRIMNKELNFGQGIIGGSKAQRENRIALFETLFSDDNIKEIQTIMNDYLSVSGVPSVYCVILQKAIDAFEALINVFYDPKRDSEKLKEIPYKDILIAVINQCTQNNWPTWISTFPDTTNKLGIMGNQKLLGTQITDDVVVCILRTTCSYLIS